MSTDIKLSKVQISKIIKLDVSYGSVLDNLDKKVLTNVGIPFDRDNLPGLARKITSNAVIKCQRNVNGKEMLKHDQHLCSFRMKVWMILLKS